MRLRCVHCGNMYSGHLTRTGETLPNGNAELTVVVREMSGGAENPLRYNGRRQTTHRVGETSWLKH